MLPIVPDTNLEVPPRNIQAIDSIASLLLDTSHTTLKSIFQHMQTKHGKKWMLVG